MNRIVKLHHYLSILLKCVYNIFKQPDNERLSLSFNVGRYILFKTFVCTRECHLIGIRPFLFRCTIADSAVYSAVATSSQGKAISKATVCVRSKIFSSSPLFNLLSSCHFSSVCITVADWFVILSRRTIWGCRELLSSRPR